MNSLRAKVAPVSCKQPLSIRVPVKNNVRKVKKKPTGKTYYNDNAFSYMYECVSQRMNRLSTSDCGLEEQSD